MAIGCWQLDLARVATVLHSLFVAVVIFIVYGYFGNRYATWEVIFETVNLVTDDWLLQILLSSFFL